MMTFVASTSTLKVYGSNFTSASVVEVNGAAVTTSFQSSTELWGTPNPGQLDAPGNYSITVNNSTAQSNALPLTVYYPTQGPQPFLALPGYYTGPQQSPAAIAVADVNGDGRTDVVLTAGMNTSNIAVLLGQADGTLGAPQYLSGGASALALGDVNGDGFPDIVAGNYPAVGSSNDPTTSSLTVLLNDGKGNFSTGVTQTFTGNYPGPMIFANILGSGRQDLLVASINPDVLYLFPNQGNGTFGQPLTVASLGPDHSFAVADFNGDGTLDIAYSGLNTSSGENTHLLLNQGGGVFNDVVPTALANVGGIVIAGDFNNDGQPDLAVETNTGLTPIVLETFLNVGTNSFTPASSITLAPAGEVSYQFAVGDFDHDGFLDIAGEDGNGTPSSVLLLWGNGSGSFATQQVVGPSGFRVATGDINGDGIPDLVIPDEEFAATVVLGQAGRTYSQPSSIYPEVASSMSVGDVNGDGFPDLFFGGDSINQIPGSVFLNDGHGNFTLAGRPSYQGETLANLNGSAKADLVTFTGDSLMIWPGTGDPNYSTAPVVIQVPANFGGLAGFLSVDLDGDGLPDLIGPNGIAWNMGNYQFDFVPMNMNGVFAIGDVNNDGRPDLITANGTFLNQGNRQFTQIANNGLPIVEGNSAVLGNFNGDGKLDIAFAMPYDEPFVTVAYGQGDGTFYVQSILAVTEYGTGVGNILGIVAGDFNSDGLDDVVTAFVFSPHVMLYTNNGKGEFESSLLATGAGASVIVKADFNMDGKPDIGILNPTSVSPSNAVIIFGH
jgi:hypothetical protein